MSVFFCDSNCELWHTRVKELNIKYISMPYTIKGQMQGYDMGENMDFDGYYNTIKSGEMPSTQALNPFDYVQYFEPILASGQDIIYVHFSHKLSGTFEYLKTAIAELKEKYPDRKITTVDTLSISMGAGSLVYEAALLHNSGASDEEVVKFVEKERQHSCAYFVVDDLQHLKRGGRISGAVAFFGGMLGIKPILKIDEHGAIINFNKTQGKKKAMLELINIMKENGEDIEKHPLTILNAGTKEEGQFMIDHVRAVVGENATIWYQQIGPTIGAHCGPGTIALVFHGKKR